MPSKLGSSILLSIGALTTLQMLAASLHSTPVLPWRPDAVVSFAELGLGFLGLFLVTRRKVWLACVGAMLAGIGEQVVRYCELRAAARDGSISQAFSFAVLGGHGLALGAVVGLTGCAVLFGRKSVAPRVGLAAGALLSLGGACQLLWSLLLLSLGGSVAEQLSLVRLGSAGEVLGRVLITVVFALAIFRGGVASTDSTPLVVRETESGAHH